MNNSKNSKNSFLPYHINFLTNLLHDFDLKFKVTDISESKLTTKKEPKNSFEIPDYCIEHTPTKSEKDGYISKKTKKLYR